MTFVMQILHCVRRLLVKTYKLPYSSWQEATQDITPGISLSEIPKQGKKNTRGIWSLTQVVPTLPNKLGLQITRLTSRILRWLTRVPTIYSHDARIWHTASINHADNNSRPLLACSICRLCQHGRLKKRADDERALVGKKEGSLLFSPGSRSPLISLVARSLFRSSSLTESLEQARPLSNHYSILLKRTVYVFYNFLMISSGFGSLKITTQNSILEVMKHFYLQNLFSVLIYLPFTLLNESPWKLNCQSDLNMNLE